MNQKGLIDFLAKQTIEEFMTEGDRILIENPEILNTPEDIEIKETNYMPNKNEVTNDLPFIV